MSGNKVKIRFDGPLLADHSMDVADLAPSLLAVADICKNANKKFNGDRASVQVLVNANLEQHCFELSIELAMTVLEQVKQLISHNDVKDAKEILEWVGLVGGPVVGGGFGLIKLIQAIKNKPIEKTEFISTEHGDVVQLTITGDNNRVEVHTTRPETYALLKDPANVEAVKKIVSPLSREGYDTLQFEETEDQVQTLSKEDAKEILQANPSDIAEALDEKEAPQEVTAWIKVYSPVYEQGAQNWRFLFNNRNEYMDISETDIAEKAISRGGALVNDTYKVRLQMVQSKSSTKLSYKILEVLEFYPAELNRQIELLSDEKPKES